MIEFREPQLRTAPTADDQRFRDRRYSFAPKAAASKASYCYLIFDRIPSIMLIRGKHETFNRLALNQSIHNLRDVRDRDAFVKEVIGFD